MTIKHLVISGGGPNILRLYGGLKYSHIKNIWSIENIESIYATSAGTIVGLIMLLRIPFDDVDNYFINRPWENIFNITPQHLLQLLKKPGIFNINSIVELLDPLFKCKQYNSNITLDELYKLTNINFVIFTSCLDDFSCKSISHKTHPDMKVLEAIYSSLSIPCIFEPLLNNNKHYFDGGLFANYPIDKCIKDLQDNTEDNIDFDEIIGFCGDRNNSKEIIETIQSFNNIFEYFFEIIKRVIGHFDVQNKNLIKHEVKIHFEPFTISVWNEFINSKEVREKNISLSIDTIDELIKNDWKK